nr:hypothetical protein [Tanacetum cinerariifolium]
MVAYISKSDPSEGLQALVDKKKVVVTEATIRDALHLDDAEGVECLPNEEIITELARMGFEKPSTKLTFYKAFFLSQWKFLIHTILQSMKEQGNDDNVTEEPVTAVSEDDLEDQSIPSPTSPTPPPQQPQDIPSTSQAQSHPPQPQSLTPAQPHGVDFLMSLLQEALDTCAALTRRVEHLKHDKVAQNLEITKLKTRVKKLERANKEKETEEVKDITGSSGIVTTTKLITKVIAAASEMVSAAAVIPTVTTAVVPAATVTPAPVKVAVSSTRRRREVVIKDPEEESSAKTPTETKSKNMEKTEAQAQRNIMMYLKNTAGFRLDYFKGMSYDDIRLIFEAKFNSNIEFLLKTKEQIEEEENRAMTSINETPTQKAAKRRRLNEEAKDVEELKQHLEIMPDKDDDVYTEATPLARKVPVVDYQIVHINNKPHFKIIRANETHQLYVSFITLLKNFDREDLESLWNIVKERFSTLKPNNFLDDFLLTTLRAMFGRPDRQDQLDGHSIPSDEGDTAILPKCDESDLVVISHRRLCRRLQKRSSKLRRLKTARSRQKSYADKRRKPLEFEVGDRVLLKLDGHSIPPDEGDTAILPKCDESDLVVIIIGLTCALFTCGRLEVYPDHVVKPPSRSGVEGVGRLGCTVQPCLELVSFVCRQETGYWSSGLKDIGRFLVACKMRLLACCICLGPFDL